MYEWVNMVPIKNPFSPGAGSPPPELVGRDPILEQARILLGRVKTKRPEKSMLLTGPRGVGNPVAAQILNSQSYRQRLVRNVRQARSHRI
jgi:DNA-binding NtrC family response regulator